MKISIRGSQYPVVVDDEGTFRVTIADELYQSDTLAGLQKAAQAGTRRRTAKVAVPFTQIRNGGVIRHGVATGVHQRHRTVLVRWDDGDADSIGRYFNDGTVLTRLTGEEEAEYIRLLAVQRQAARAVAEFETPRKIRNLQSMVTAAIDAELNRGGGDDGGS